MLLLSLFLGDGTRDVFLMNKSLVTWIEKNLDAAKRKDNLLHNLQREVLVNQRLTQKELLEREWALQDRIGLLSEKYQKLLLVENTDFDSKQIPASVVIYGCGDIGRALFKRLKSKCKILCFLDAFSQETEFDGISVLKPNAALKIDKKVMIIITAHDFEKIADLLQEIYGSDNNIVSIDEFCRDAGGMEILCFYRKLVMYDK